MAMTIKKADAAFERALKAARRLLEVNDYVNWPSGTPARQQALYGSVVVMTVGAWQGVIEDLAQASYEVTKRRVQKAKLPLDALAGVDLTRFNTPNQANTQKLLGRAGVEMPSSWTVSSAGGNLTDTQAWEVIEAWLQVRHAIAHGFPFSESARLQTLLTYPHVAGRVLTASAPGGSSARALRLVDAQGCIELIQNVAAVVRKAAERHKSKNSS